MIKPTFKPKPFKDGSGWSVEVERPDGSIEYVDQFGSDSEALEWITNKSEKWLQKHPKSKLQYDHQTPTHLMPETLKALPLSMPNVRLSGVKRTLAGFRAHPFMRVS